MGKTDPAMRAGRNSTMTRTTIYHDGNCPLCSAEIDSYRRKDTAGALAFVDVSDPAAILPQGIDRQSMMARLHVMCPDGRIVSGARAFIDIWECLDAFRLLARLGRIPGAAMVLEGAYRLFLPLRPGIVRAFVALRSLRPAR